MKRGTFTVNSKLKAHCLQFSPVRLVNMKARFINVLLLGLACSLFVASLLKTSSTSTSVLDSISLQAGSFLPPESLHPPTSPTHPQPYQPSQVEQYLIDHAKELGYDKKLKQSARGCDVWKNASLTTESVFENLTQYLEDLKVYERLLMEFNGSQIPDVRKTATNEGPPRFEICESLELHPQGLAGIFAKSGQLSLAANQTGYIEPLLPPMRHPHICDKFRRHLLTMTYLVHDFSAMCRQLKRHSRIILIDMGASLDFHKSRMAPPVYLAQLFMLFGMPFDHIYAFEVTPTDPASVYEKLPDNLMPAYHWMNVPVDSSPQAKLNPLKSLVRTFDHDDLVIVKLDIDSPGIEEALALQIRNDPALSSGLIDHFYFEHHVFLAELNGRWMHNNNRQTVEESLQLFQELRRKGTASHFWV